MTSRWISVLILWSLAPLVEPVQAQTLTVERDQVLTRYGEVITRSIPLFPLTTGIGKVFEQVIREPGALALRLHFKVQASPPTASWGVRVVDRNGKPLWFYSSVGEGAPDFWSDELAVDSLTVEVYSVQDQSSLELLVDRVAKSGVAVTPRAITPPDQRASIGDQSAQIRGWGRSVARLRFVGDDGGQYFCTGFLVSADLFLTNHHCIQSEGEMRSALVDFDYDASAAQPFNGRFKELVEKDAELDFALLRLAQRSDRQALRLEISDPAENQALIVIQHPAGEPKQVSLLDCRVRNALISGTTPRQTDFGHLCDTLGGSSGSPVQDIGSGGAIGLHHLGFRPGSDRPVNQAVRLRLIVDFLRTKRPAVLTEMGIPPS